MLCYRCNIMVYVSMFRAELLGAFSCIFPFNLERLSAAFGDDYV
jgi:hypothetical protein